MIITSTYTIHLGHFGVQVSRKKCPHRHEVYFYFYFQVLFNLPNFLEIIPS